MAEKAARVTISTVKTALQSVIAPDLNEIKTTLRVLDTKLDSTNNRITEMEKRMESMKNELRSEIKAVDTKVEQLDKRLDVVQRLAVVEAEIKELKRK